MHRQRASDCQVRGLVKVVSSRFSYEPARETTEVSTVYTSPFCVNEDTRRAGRESTSEPENTITWKICKFFRKPQAADTVHVFTVEPSVVREVCCTSLHDTRTSTAVQQGLHPRQGTAPLPLGEKVDQKERALARTTPTSKCQEEPDKPCRSPRSPCCCQCHSRRHRTLTPARPGKCWTRATSSCRSPAQPHAPSIVDEEALQRRSGRLMTRWRP